MMRKIKNAFLNIIIIIILCAIIYLMKDVLSYYYDRYKFDKINNEIEETVDRSFKDNKNTISEIQSDFKNVVAYISIPDVDIKYPIAQAKDNDYYLYRDLYDNYSEVGTIYLDCQNNKDFSDINTIIYGHNMREGYPGGDAFGKIDHYLDQGFTYDAQKIIEIITEKETLKYRIITAYSVDKDYNYRQITPNNPKDYILEMMNNSIIDFDVDKNSIKDDDKIITLSTCVNSLNPDRRFVIQAKKID